MAHDNTALWFMTAGSFTLLTPTANSWGNTQPADFVVFNDRLFACNGQTALGWDGNTVLPLGLPAPKTNPTFIQTNWAGSGASVWTMFGSFTMAMPSGGIGNWQGVAVFAAYSYIRTDGYYGPVNFVQNAINITGQSLGMPGTSGNDVTTLVFSGMTTPPGQGITAIAVWLGLFPWTAGNYVSVFGHAPASIPGDAFGITLAPQDSLNNFYLYTLYPSNQITASINFGGVAFSGVAVSFDNNQPFSGMPFGFFQSNVPKYVDLYQQGYMVYAGFSNNPSSLAISNIGEPEIIDPNFINFEFRTNDGDRLFGIKSFGNQMLVFKERSFHMLLGTLPNVTTSGLQGGSIQSVQLSDQYGCLSKRTVVSFNQKLLWLDRKGILEYNGATWDIISEPVEPIFRRMNITAAYENACAVHHHHRNQIWWGIPIDGSTVNNITVVFDYLEKEWTLFDGFNPASFALIKNSQPKYTAWRGDYSGYVYFHQESLMTDNGQPFTLLAQPRFENVGGENQTSLWRRFFLDTQVQANDTEAVNLIFFSNYNSTTVQATASIEQNVPQNREEIGVQGKAVGVQWSYYGTFPMLVYGYAWGARGLRNV